MGLDVADGHEDVADPLLVGNLAAAAPQRDGRSARRGVADLNVRPPDAVAPARAEDLQDGLLDGEATGEVLGLAPVSAAVGQLVRREDAPQEPVPVPRDDLGEAPARLRASVNCSDHPFSLPSAMAWGRQYS